MLTNTQRSPLAAAQTSMWYYEKLYPGTPAYHYTIVFDLENPKVDQLRTAIEALALRHEALQCRVVEMRGQAYLEPLSAATSTSSSWPLQIFELRTESPPPVEDLMETLESIQAAAFITKGFLFDQEPLWRCALLAFSENKYQFVMVAHHIIVDVTSMNILMRDLSEIYNALLENRPPSLTALPSLYQLKLASCNHEAKLALWKERLSGLTPLVIKTDFMPQSDFRYHSDRFNFKISRDQVQALSALAEAQQVSLHRLFLASLYILLHRYTGCTDICIGTTSANRRNYSEKVEEVVSSFINSIPLRVSIEGKLRFDEFLEKLSLICIEAYENQLPFEVIASQALGKKEKKKTTTTSPFDIIFNLNQKRTALSLKDARTSYPSELNLGYSKFTYFGLNLDELPDGSYRGFVEYNLALFKESTIIRMVEHLKNIWTAITNNPQEKIADIFLLTPEESSILAIANQTTKDLDFDGNTVTDIFHAIVKARGKETAVVFHSSLGETESISYSNLNKKADTLASLLRAKGVGPEKIVGLSLSRSINLITALWAVFKASGVVLPLETDSSELLKHKLLQSQPKVLIVDQLTKDLEVFTTYAEKIINIDDWSLIKRQSNQLGIQVHQQKLKSTDLAYITFTSGSTGEPKGVMSTYQGLSNAAFAVDDRKLKPNSKVLCTAKPTFDCFFFEVLEALMTGGELHLIFEEGRLSPSVLQSLISQHGLNTLTLLPQVSNYLNFELLPSLNDIVIMGAVPNEETIKRLGILVEQRKASQDPLTIRLEYGVQEASIFSSEHAYQFVLPHTVIGKPIRNTRLFILDKEGRYECPLGVVGEIYIEGLSLARGYFNNLPLTQEKFLIKRYEPAQHQFLDFDEKEAEEASAQPALKKQKLSTSQAQNFKADAFSYHVRLYKTGDSARRLEDGSLEFIGRIEGNKQVKIHGVRIELDSLERLLQGHPNIKDCLLSFDSEKETLKGYLILKNPDEVLSNLQLNAYLRQFPLPLTARLSSVFIVDKFPITANGKLDVAALERSTAETRTQEEKNELGLRCLPGLVSENSLQNQLKKLWEDILDTRVESIHESFAELGGDSLSLISLETRLNEQFTLINKISVIDLSPDMTIQSLSERIKPILMSNVPLSGNPATTFRSMPSSAAEASSESKQLPRVSTFHWSSTSLRK